MLNRLSIPQRGTVSTQRLVSFWDALQEQTIPDLEKTLRNYFTSFKQLQRRSGKRNKVLPIRSFEESSFFWSSRIEPSYFYDVTSVFFLFIPNDRVLLRQFRMTQLEWSQMSDQANPKSRFSVILQSTKNEPIMWGRAASFQRSAFSVRKKKLW